MGVTKNLGWRLVSLVLAILLWLAFSSAPVVVTTHSAPIVYNNLTNGWMVAGNSPEIVHLELRGPAGRLTAASLAETVVRVDLASVGSTDDRTFTISQANLNLPPGVTFLRAVPSQLRLQLAQLAEKVVRVAVRFSGALPPGYRITAQSVSPEQLRIAGPEMHVAAVNQVETDPIDLHSLRQSSAQRVDAFVDDPQVHFESPPQVTVHLIIKPIGK